MIDDKAVLQKCKERKMPIEATVFNYKCRCKDI
jgi:hypothetical protein